MRLTDWVCSGVFGKYFALNVHAAYFEICVVNEDKSTFELLQDYFIDGETHLKLTNSVYINKDYTYAVTMKFKKGLMTEDLYTYGAELPKKWVDLTPNVKIAFPYRGIEQEYTRSMISRMYLAPASSNMNVFFRRKKSNTILY